MDTATLLSLLRRLAQAKPGRDALQLPADLTPREALQAVRTREEQGSTFFNEGVAFPHARVAGLTGPLVALGLTRGGVSDAAVEKPVEYVFLSLSPIEKPEIQIQLLALAARAFQNRRLSQALQAAVDTREVLLALKSWEGSSLFPKAAPPNIFH